MEEEEIEEWYEEQKTKITDDYRKKIDKSKNHDRLKAQYTARLDRLQRQYESKAINTSQLRLKMFFLNYRFNNLKAKLMKPLKDLSEKFGFHKKQGPES